MENHEDKSIKINRSPKEGLKKKRMDSFPPLNYQNNYIQCNMFIAFMNIYLIANLCEYL